MTLYWVFVGLFILSIGMFVFGVFAGNVSIGALGVIIVFLLYLFRRWFLPETPTDTDANERGVLSEQLRIEAVNNAMPRGLVCGSGPTPPEKTAII